MNPAMICPVCGLKSIEEGKENCPQCNSDLSCFKVLDKIGSEAPKSIVPQKRASFPIFFFFLLLVLLLLSSFSLYRFYTLESRIKKQERHFSSLVTDINSKWNILIQKQSEMSAIQKEPAQPVPSEAPVLSPKPSGVIQTDATPPQQKELAEFFTYHADDKDTLWTIAKKFYGSGSWYPVILEHNPTVEIFSIKNGVQLKILTDTAKAKDIFTTVVLAERNRSFWNYTVKEGDTPESLAVRFYGEKANEKQIFDFNPNIRIEPGQKIKILIQ